jgi:hypothetical protein
MAGDRPRALFFVLVLLTILAVFYFFHLRNEAARAAATAGKEERTTFSSLLALLGGDMPAAPAAGRPDSPPPQNIAVRIEAGELRALEPVRIGDATVAEVRFIFREEGDWLLVDTARTGTGEHPCRGVMKKEASRLAIARCGTATQKSAKEMTKNLKNK